MIPDNINIDELTQQLNQDSVALGEYGHTHPGAEQNIVTIIDNAEARGWGSFAFVALDQTPPHTADLRDIAQELLNNTAINTVIVRAPDSGAIVSDQYSRKTLEEAQWGLLGNSDHVSAVEDYVTQVGSDTTPWTAISLLMGCAIAVAIGCVFTSFFRTSDLNGAKSSRLAG